jgi:hypothetical protein
MTTRSSSTSPVSTIFKHTHTVISTAITIADESDIGPTPSRFELFKTRASSAISGHLSEELEYIEYAALCAFIYTRIKTLTSSKFQQ